MDFKLLLAVLGLAVCAFAEVIVVEDDDGTEITEISYEEAEKQAEQELDDLDDDSARAFWNVAFNMLKKVLRIEPLKCNGAICNTCLSVFGKGGCFKVAYNKMGGKKAQINLELNVNNKRRWTGHINAGRYIPSCINFKGPIKVVCLQDFTCSVAENGIPAGEVCFTINFKNYRLGANFCGYFTYGSFVPIVIPNIKKT